jgi:hypothetical protein
MFDLLRVGEHLPDQIQKLNIGAAVDGLGYHVFICFFSVHI